MRSQSSASGASKRRVHIEHLPTVTARIATTLSGHKTRSVFDRYDIVSEVDLVQATQKLQFHFGATAKAA